VRNLRDWLDRSGISSGPLFRPVDRHGRMKSHRLSSRAIADLVCRRFPTNVGASYSGHSLRAGHVTAAVRAGKSLSAIKRQTGHTTIATLDRYVREATLFQDNASSGIGL
jgi:integrase